MARRADFYPASAAWPAAPPTARARGPRVELSSVALLRFALPRAVEATVDVHDTRGLLVRTLLSGEIASGEHACGWDGRDEREVPVLPGEYTLRLTVGERVVTSRRITIG